MPVSIPDEEEGDVSQRSRGQTPIRPELVVQEAHEDEDAVPAPAAGANGGSVPPTAIAAPPGDAGPEEPTYSAPLTVEELTGIRKLNDAIDGVAEEIRTREAALVAQQKELVQLRTVKDGAQEALIGRIRAAIVAHNLAPGVMYRVDIDSGQLLPGQQQPPPQVPS